MASPAHSANPVAGARGPGGIAPALVLPRRAVPRPRCMSLQLRHGVVMVLRENGRMKAECLSPMVNLIRS